MATSWPFSSGVRGDGDGAADGAFEDPVTLFMGRQQQHQMAKTPAQIISEARASVYPSKSGKIEDIVRAAAAAAAAASAASACNNGKGTTDGAPSSSARRRLPLSAVKTVSTKRPFTPNCKERRLYSGTGQIKGPPANRPSSSFQLQLIEEESFLRSPSPIVAELQVPAAPTTRPSGANAHGRQPDPPAVQPSAAPRSGGLSRLQFRQRTSRDSEEEAFEKTGPITSSPAAASNNKKRPASTSAGSSTSAPDSSISSCSSSSDSSSSSGSSSIKDDDVEEGPGNLVSFDEVLEQMGGSQGDDSVCQCLEAVLVILERESPNRRRRPEKAGSGGFLSGNQKKALLRLMSRHLSSDNAKVLFPLVEILMVLRVTKSNFALASKLMFKLAKDEANDSHFLSRPRLAERYLSSLGRQCPVDDGEAFVYGYGALKFFSLNQEVVGRLAKLGFVQLAALHLKLLCCPVDPEAVKTGSSASNVVLFQITSCLRNMMNLKECKDAFAGMGGIDLVLGVVAAHPGDVDVMCNLTRTLSVLSAEEDAYLDTVSDKDRLVEAVYGLLARYGGDRRDMVVRLAFCLGNLAAVCDDSRQLLGKNPNTTSLLPDLLNQCIDHLVDADDDDDDYERASDESNRRVHPGVKGGPQGGPDDRSVGKVSSSAGDTAVKIIRVFANVSINQEAGATLALCEHVVGTLLRICCLRPKSNNNNRSYVLLPTLATLNNLSFYPLIQQKAVYTALKKHLSSSNQRVCAEAARVFGNLSRTPDVRKCFLTDGLMRVVLKTLTALGNRVPQNDLMADDDDEDSEDSRDLACACAGILVNVLSDQDHRAIFLDLSGVQTCVGILEGRCLEEEDWTLASLLCQALWNYCIDASSIIDEGCIPNEEVLCHLEDALVYLLETCNQSANTREGHHKRHQMALNDIEAKEFAKVGLGLLKRILDDSPRKVELLLDDP